MQTQAANTCFVGVDLRPERIRAGAFTAALKLAGRIKRSTKAERGPEAILARVARCILEAVDEADFKKDDVRRVGIGVPGEIDPASGRLLFAPLLGLDLTEFQGRLEEALGLPVNLESTWHLASLGIFASELQAGPSSFAALFPGQEIRGAVYQNQTWQPILPAETTPATEVADKSTDAPAVAAFSRVGWSPKDLRKAARRGEPAALRAMQELAERIGVVVARVVREHHPAVICLGGNLAEEIRGPLMSVVLESAQKNGLAGDSGRAPLISKLGDDACIFGAAILASQSS